VSENGNDLTIYQSAFPHGNSVWPRRRNRRRFRMCRWRPIASVQDRRCPRSNCRSGPSRRCDRLRGLLARQTATSQTRLAIPGRCVMSFKFMSRADGARERFRFLAVRNLCFDKSRWPWAPHASSIFTAQQHHWSRLLSGLRRGVADVSVQ
jgi:hypothetical protein